MIPRFCQRRIGAAAAFVADLDVENVSACPAGACDPEFDWRPRGSALVAVLSASRPAGDPPAPVGAPRDLIRARGSPVNVLSARPRPARPPRGRRIIMMTDTAGTRTRDRSDDEPWVVAGVDTHKDTHHVAAGSAATGAGLGDMRVPATPAGYDQPRDFVRSHGRIRMIGIEGTGSYGAGLARALRAAGAPIREVIRPKRSQRRRGKSDPIDAYAAAGRALAEADALPVAKTGTGPCEQIRVLLAWRRSAMKARVAAHRQITALLTTAPDAVRTRFARLWIVLGVVEGLNPWKDEDHARTQEVPR